VLGVKGGGRWGGRVFLRNRGTREHQKLPAEKNALIGRKRKAGEPEGYNKSQEGEGRVGLR